MTGYSDEGQLVGALFLLLLCVTLLIICPKDPEP
jgi:hypothetical protein